MIAYPSSPDSSCLLIGIAGRCVADLSNRSVRLADIQPIYDNSRWYNILLWQRWRMRFRLPSFYSIEKIKTSCLFIKSGFCIFRFYITRHIIISLKIIIFCITVGYSVTDTPVICQIMFLVCINRITVYTLTASQGICSFYSYQIIV